MSLRSLVLTCIAPALFFFALETKAQSEPELDFRTKSFLPPPAEAASINKGGDVGVNLSSGAPSISIPLASGSSRFISVNASLNYASNGIRVNDLAPFTGLGWSLNCGGAVTRTTLGMPDEDRLQYNTDFTNWTKLTVTPIDRPTMNYLTGVRDRESDVFSFSVNGYIDGKFILNDQRVPILISGKNCKISVLNGIIKDGFQVIDDKGTIYQFTEKDTSYYDRGACATDPGERVRPVFNTWHLSKIIMPYQDTVYFNYTSNNYRYVADVNENESICITSGVGGCGSEDPSATCPLFSEQYTRCQTQQEVKGRILKEVIFVNGKLEFEYTDNRKDMVGGKALRNVILSNGEGVLRHLTLNTNYLLSAARTEAVGDTTGRYRLMLRSIDVRPQASAAIEMSYGFGYLNENLLPARFCAGQDHYGLANGSINNNYFLTNIVEDIRFWQRESTYNPSRYGNRSPDSTATFMLAGLLNKVVYPTGGIDSIVYTPNLQYTQRIFKRQVEDFINVWPPDGSTGTADTLFFNIGYPQKVEISMFVQPKDLIVRVHDRAYSHIYKVGTNHLEKSWGTDYASGWLSEKFLIEEPGAYYLRDSMAKDDMYLERTFRYEPVPDSFWMDWPIGGVSVAKIISKDSITNQPIVKSYSYKFRDSKFYSTRKIVEEEKYSYINTVRRFMNCDRVPDCEGLSYCTWLVHGSTQIRPESLVGGNFFYHNVVTETVTGADSIDRSTEHQFEYNFQVGARVETGSYVIGTPYGVMPDFLLGEKQTIQYSYNRLTKAYQEHAKTRRELRLTERFLVDNFNVSKIYESPCTGGTQAPTAVEKGSVSVTAYPIYFQQVDVVAQYDTVFTGVGGTYTASTKLFEYTPEPYYYLRGSKTTGSKGDTLASRMTYIFDETSHAMKTPMLAQNVLGLTKIVGTRAGLPTQSRIADYRFANGSAGLISQYKITEQIRSNTPEVVSERTVFTSLGQPAEVLERDQRQVLVWGYNDALVTCSVIGAALADVAHTSFEQGQNSAWNIPSATRSTLSITGKQAFDLALAGAGGITRTGLTASLEYTVSYYTRNAVALTIAGTVGAAKKGQTVNGWTYFEHTISGVTTATVAGSGVLDELRLYPASALMTTYTHTPQVGVTSKCDANAIVEYYEYDGLGRLQTVKNIEGKILQQKAYKYKAPVL